MKKHKLFILAGIMAIFCNCSDPAIGDEYGEALIYMPQATHNLGTDNNLNLTISMASVAANPGQKTQTTLGIYRSGTHAKQSATVDLTIDADTIASARQHALQPDAPTKYAIYLSGVLMAQKYYESLPDQLTIPDGERQSTTQLILKDGEILNDYSVGDILLLPVRIENPTRYELNESLSLTMVVITIVN